MSSNLCPLAKARNPANLPAEQGCTPGSLFRDARRNAGYSIDTIAERLGLDERTIRRWQRDETKLDLVLLCERVPEVGRVVAEALLGRKAA